MLQQFQAVRGTGRVRDVPLPQLFQKCLKGSVADFRFGEVQEEFQVQRGP